MCLLCFLGSHRSRCEIVVQKRTNRPVKENDNTSCSIVGIRASMSKLTGDVQARQEIWVIVCKQSVFAWDWHCGSDWDADWKLGNTAMDFSSGYTNEAVNFQLDRNGAC